MNDIQPLSDWLESDTQRFQKKKRMFVFTDLIHRGTGEKVEEGFRYFACDIGAVLGLFDAGDIVGLSRLEYALDEDGDRDTSSVRVDLAYTPGFGFAAIQPVQYIEHAPTPLRPAMVLEGDEARRFKDALLALGE